MTITVEDAKRRARRARVRLPSGNLGTLTMVRRHSGRGTVQVDSGSYANVWLSDLVLLDEVTDA